MMKGYPPDQPFWASPTNSLKAVLAGAGSLPLQSAILNRAINRDFSISLTCKEIKG
ncbi:MAG: hypothetical protein AABY49_05330 [Planctomycetota bacterium]